MYEIDKQPQPNSLTLYKRQHDATYDNLPSEVKAETKNALLAEQGHVCAYCMARIKFSKMRLEHWASQEGNTELQLDYNNMLACCQGNEGQDKETHTCDKKKANLVLKYSPSNSEHRINSRVYYQGDGKIRSSEQDFDSQLNTVLNLNESRLLSNRVAALEAIYEKLNSRQGTRTKQQIRAMRLEVLARNGSNKKKPYFGFLAQYLESKL